MKAHLSSWIWPNLALLALTYTWFLVLTIALSPVLARSSKWSASSDSESGSQVRTSLELQCPPCEQIHCHPKKASRLKCKGGVTTGICNCCPVCAKVEGEECGGINDYQGKCDRGLYCKPSYEDHHESSKEVLDIFQNNRQKPLGRCTKVLRKQLSERELMDQPAPYYCRPKCTPEYCQENPKAVCSAIDNAERKQNCQGDCQHTACSACRFVHELPECDKCEKDDFRCLRRFGHCIKKDYCSRQKYPCKKVQDEPGSKFKCLVPECISP